MAGTLSSFIDLLTARSQRWSPNKPLGTSGAAVYGGYIVNYENDPLISTHDNRYRTYSDILANTTIVAAGVRYFLNVITKAQWTFKPSEADTDGFYADIIQEMLMEDPVTSWARIVRRAAMFRFYGFSVQEWTARRRDEDGIITLKDISPRAQVTIERWDVDTEGKVLGAVQTAPYDEREIYLPREKILYLVDDALNDTPEGFGLFRHLVRAARRLTRYEQLEGYGFETDLRGIPIGRAPFQQLADMEARGEISDVQRRQIEDPIRTFIKSHIKNPELGILLDSLPYESGDEAARPSQVRQWDVELMTSESNSFAENAAAIERLNREIARVLGVEQLLLGSDSSGSFAMSSDKTNAFFLLTEGALTEIREQVSRDLVDRLFELNGWDMMYKPEVSTEAIQFTNVEAIAGSLRDLAQAGAVLSPTDPAINQVRSLMGLADTDEDTASLMEAMALTDMDMSNNQADSEMDMEANDDSR